MSPQDGFAALTPAPHTITLCPKCRKVWKGQLEACPVDGTSFIAPAPRHTYNPAPRRRRKPRVKPASRFVPRIVFTETERDYLAWCEEGNRGVQELQSIADSYLYLFDDLPRVKFLFEDTGGSNAIGLYFSGFHMPGRRRGGQRVEIHNNHYKNAPYANVLNTILHELVHAWTDWKGLLESDGDHGPVFRSKAEEVGVNINAYRPSW